MKKGIPTWLRTAKQDIPLIAKDTFDRLLGRRDPLIPPRRLMYDGPKSVAVFKENGMEFFKYYTELCDLKPDEKILDIGSGIGRKTIPLLTYLNQEGEYEGFDINEIGIKWCQQKISTRYPNFRFRKADIFNKLYNPTGKYKAAEYRFPYEDERFDFVVLGSVFTHMLPEDVEHYLSEIARVLKTGKGRCLCSFFLFNQESRALIKDQKSSLNFKHEFGNYGVVDAEVPEKATGYDEKFVRGLYEKYGLKIVEPIHYGSWCSRQEFLSYQDLVVARKA